MISLRKRCGIGEGNDRHSALNRRPPAEADIAAYFQITAPSAHGMVETLTKAKLIARVPGKARSIRLLIAAGELPSLA